MAKRNVKWLFATPMIAAAILGPITFGGYLQIRDAWRHEGRGYISSGEDDPRLVSESHYKREKYVMGVMLMGFGIAGWVIVAHAHRNRNESRDDRE